VNAFMAAFLSDVSAELPPSWQLVDMGATCLKVALRAVDLQKQEKTVAALQSVLNVLTTLINARVSGQGGSTPSSPQVSGSVDAGAADADSQPGAAGGGTGDGGDAQ